MLGIKVKTYIIILVIFSNLMFQMTVQMHIASCIRILVQLLSFLGHHHGNIIDLLLKEEVCLVHTIQSTDINSLPQQGDHNNNKPSLLILDVLLLPPDLPLRLGVNLLKLLHHLHPPLLLIMVEVILLMGQ